MIRYGLKFVALADRIHEIILDQFKQTSSKRWIETGMTVVETICEIAQVDTDIAEDIQSYLSHIHYSYEDAKEGQVNPYGDDVEYESKSAEVWRYQGWWNSVSTDVRTRSRFFSQSARELLKDLFNDLESQQTHDQRPVIRRFDPGQKENVLYRARTALSPQELEKILSSPVQQLGPPPFSRAKSGRMNPSGVSVFYGAFDSETCIAELRPPVGSNVVVGRFQLLRPVRLLDLDALRGVYYIGSYFCPDSSSRWAKAAFLSQLDDEFGKPVMPGDEESEYLPTQFVADFLANHFTPPIDGVLYKASQVNSPIRSPDALPNQNLVLFPRACGVKPYDLPKGSEVDIEFYREGRGDDYEVVISEEVPSEPGEESSATRTEPRYGGLVSLSRSLPFQGEEERYPPSHNPTLELDVESIQVFSIRGAQYDAAKRLLHRFRRSKVEGSEQPY